MYHNKLPGFLLCMFFCVQINFTISNSLGRDTANISGTIYYKLGYKKTSVFPSIRSAFSVQKLAQTEWEVYNEVTAYCNSVSNSIFCGAAESYIKDYEETSLVFKNTNPDANFTQVIAGNLNGIYRMIRRFREYIKQWTLPTPRQRVSMDVHFVKKLKEVYNASEGPSRIDMHIAMFAIALTQFQLNLNTKDIANGIFQGRETGIQLKAIHCLEIGIHSIATGLFPIGIEWLEHALHKTKHGDKTTSELMVEEYLQQAKMKHDKYWRPKDLKDMELVFYEKPLNQTPDSSERKWRKTLNLSRAAEYVSNENFWSLCNNNNEQVSTSNLFCWHERRIHPIWTIGPLKAELLSTTSDQVIQFHDIIGPAQTTKIRTAISSKFIPAILTFFNVFYPRVKLGYICKFKNLTAIGANLEKLAVRVTGLKVDVKTGGSESFEPTSYPPGGYNSLHPDWSSSRLGVLNERMATFIIYLDAPEVGGNTALPKLDVAVKPLKGSAVLWYNVHSSGEHALKTLHGACPVVLGQKLIALKWIPYHNQDQLMCDQNQTAGVNYLVNGRAKSRLFQGALPPA